MATQETIDSLTKTIHNCLVKGLEESDTKQKDLLLQLSKEVACKTNEESTALVKKLMAEHEADLNVLRLELTEMKEAARVRAMETNQTELNKVLLEMVSAMTKREMVTVKLSEGHVDCESPERDDDVPSGGSDDILYKGLFYTTLLAGGAAILFYILYLATHANFCG